MTEGVVLHSLTGPPGSRLAAWLDAGPQLHGSFGAVIGPSRRIVVRISGPEQLLREAQAGLPDGPARAEAVAIRLRRLDVDVTWGEPVVASDIATVVGQCRARGRSSVEVLRSDPSLITELQIGAWFEAACRARLVRRMLRRAPSVANGLARSLQLPLAWRTATDTAFWSGVADVSTPWEWRRLTASSYPVLCYHRLAGEGKPGQESLDLPPERFSRQLRLLRRLGFRPLGPTELLRFHSDPEAVLPRRRYVVTADDAYLDCVEPLRLERGHRPQLFVPTAAVSGTAHWADGEPVATWQDLLSLTQSGVAVGSHSRRHASLPQLDDQRLENELAGSMQDLNRHLPKSMAVLAYPHGRHDSECEPQPSPRVTRRRTPLMSVGTARAPTPGACDESASRPMMHGRASYGR